jgi:transposase InsO family protein
MDRRREFVSFAGNEDANISALCRSFGISRKTGYKWLSRAVSGDGAAALADHSRRPHSSPRRTAGEIEAAILAVRAAHPAWGARKIAHVLAREGLAPPAPSTVHAILARHGRIGSGGGQGKAFGRFEKAAPNLLWQMDFKGEVQLGDGGWCYPLTVIDDHSRFALCLEGCGNQRTPTVRQRLEQTFRRYGLPAAFYVDNGPPWGGGAPGRFTPLTVWLMKLAIDVIHATPARPQGRGKNERFHRALKSEVFDQPVRDLQRAQESLDAWRHVYNHQRPHEALDMQVPPPALPAVGASDAVAPARHRLRHARVRQKSAEGPARRQLQGQKLARPQGLQGRICRRQAHRQRHLRHLLRRQTHRHH